MKIYCSRSQILFEQFHVQMYFADQTFYGTKYLQGTYKNQSSQVRFQCYLFFLHIEHASSFLKFSPSTRNIYKNKCYFSSEKFWALVQEHMSVGSPITSNSIQLLNITTITSLARFLQTMKLWPKWVSPNVSSQITKPNGTRLFPLSG